MILQAHYDKLLTHFKGYVFLHLGDFLDCIKYQGLIHLKVQHKEMCVHVQVVVYVCSCACACIFGHVYVHVCLFHLKSNHITDMHTSLGNVIREKQNG